MTIPMPLMSNSHPPSFGLNLTTMAPLMAMTAKIKAAMPNPLMDPPEPVVALSTAPKNIAKNAPPKPKIPPISPRTNSVVRFNMKTPFFLYLKTNCQNRSFNKNGGDDP